MLTRKLFRTAWKYKAQFLSMIIMVAIGVGIFVGFNAEWYSLKRDTDAFFESSAYADYRLYREQGFSQSDIDAIKGISGVDAATRVLAVNVGVKDTAQSLSLFVSEEDTVSRLTLTDGQAYDATSDGFWLSDRFAEANGVKIGDTLTVTYRNFEISGEVVGLCKSAEYMICVADDNQLMPDYTTFGFVYASPRILQETLGSSFWPQINLTSDMEKAELEEAVNEALGTTTLLLSREEHYSYAGAQSEVEEGKTMGAIMPVLFLLIGILTMVTTMHRITVNEKTQIGTLKALGFKDRRILRHYTSYGFVIGVIGSAIGVGLGFGIAYMVVSPNGMEATYFDMPSWRLYVPWFCWLAVAVTVAFLTLIGFLSVKRMLSGTASDALRPYVPKKMRALAIEKTGLWGHLSFSARWNLRDTVRHKARSLMTLIGVVGCMLLLVGGLGMRDTMTEYLDVIDERIFNYRTQVSITEDADNDTALAFAEAQGGDWLASSSVQLDNKVVTLDVYQISHDKIRFIDEGNRTVALGDDGVYLCLRLAENLQVGDTITFSPYGSDESYSVRVAGVIRSVMTENITMTQAYADQIGLPYHISSVFTDTAKADIQQADYISGTQTKEALMDSYDTFMEIMVTMVLLLVIAAVVLGVVVLYNLGIMSYMERYRELATLKVVGFQDRRIGHILISQNIFLTVIGVLIGIPAGIGVLNVLIVSLASEYELKPVITPLSVLFSVLLTFGVSLVVSFFVARKNRKIDMVESLKGAE